ncbi:MAG: tRNA (N6-isopentenyl adenosine(37)-C2)-methylthiotransferase MiaB [Clostridia bacterium]|nr:tRNA (N6-isopentenyl adenosine(37)-C2)-methylthiotransferase MiaB [Clostridia bacterium]
MKYFITTYGCQMNVHESEKIAGMLSDIGYDAATSAEEADVIVFNTCCIRDTAEKRAYGNIGALKGLKKTNPEKIIAVVGCMTQQKGGAEALAAKFPFVDVILGTNSLDMLPILVQQKRAKTARIVVNEDPTVDVSVDLPIHRTSGTNAWINIMYGCNNFCTYCIVPYVRGRERSRAISEVLADVKQVLSEGYKEITLLGQNVDSYGSDLKDGTNFAALLKEISALPGKFRLRFMTSHPKDFNKEVVDVIASSRNICHNIHLPIQSGSNEILRRMNRKYTVEQYLDIVEYIKAKMPDVGITSDIMIGFPGETEEDFKATCDLVEKVRFSNAFTFVYSPRKGTPAAKMEQIPADVKKSRITRLVKLQNDVTKRLSDDYIGNVYEILIEDVNPKYPGTVCGRTDSGRLVTVNGDPSLIGEFCDVKITKSRSASLFGEIVTKENQ